MVMTALMKIRFESLKQIEGSSLVEASMKRFSSTGPVAAELIIMMMSTMFTVQEMHLENI